MRGEDSTVHHPVRGPILNRRALLKAGALSAACAAIPAAALAPASADSVILVWLDGGPSAQETFDPRPDAPADLRGPLGAISTTVPGLPIGALMPRMAAQMRVATLVRTLSHREAVHHRACRALLTVPGSDSPLRPLNSACVVVGNRDFACGYGPGGPAGPVEVRATSPPAISMLRNESTRTRDQYGHRRFGQSCLLARRLVEKGTRFVTVVHGGWDTHCDAIESARGWLVPTLDQGLAALLEDLSQRGLLDRTLVVVMGEFGRSPRLNALAGRDHFPAAGFALLAGAGAPRGHVIGCVDPATGEPGDTAVSPEQLSATVLAKLGAPGFAPDARLW